MIEVAHLSKSYGSTAAVQDLSFTAPSGQVTGFLGPNGAGKSTTMRMILGLDHPPAGRATPNGRPFSAFRNPLREVGSLLDAASAPARMTARNHLRWLARAANLSQHRVDELLETVGLASVAHRRIGSFSLGMRQRLGIAAALLGDPGTVLLDEPVNGLDPEGVRWIRQLMQDMAADGRTVLVSSHLMAETQQVADRVVVIGQGRLIADQPLTELMDRVAGDRVQVLSADQGSLADALRDAGGSVDVADAAADDPPLSVSGLTSQRIGTLAHDAGIALHLLAPRTTRLEDAFMELTESATSHAHRTETIR